MSTHQSTPRIHDERRDHKNYERGRGRSRSPWRGRSRSRSRPGRPVDEGMGKADRRERHDRERDRERSRERDREKERDRKTRKSRSRSRDRGRRHGSFSRSRSRSRSRERSHRSSKKDAEKRKRRRSLSRSRSSSRSSKSSDSEDDRKRRRKDKGKERKKRRKESRERKKERKKDKKERKDKKMSSSSHWGKFGIITEVDIFSKRAEFHAWLVEERKVNPETLAKDQERKEFAKFIEDYNTATLPHEKFYNMERYERRMDALRQGEFLPPADDMYDPEADMRALSGSRKKKAAERESYISREQLEELRKVQHERTQVRNMKLLGMEIKQSMGVRMDGTAFDEDF